MIGQIKEQIMELTRVYCAHTTRKESTVGAYAVNDGKFIKRLRNGGGLTVETAERASLWLSRNWPVDLEWPRHISRPNPKREAP